MQIKELKIKDKFKYMGNVYTYLGRYGNDYIASKENNVDVFLFGFYECLEVDKISETKNEQ